MIFFIDPSKIVWKDRKNMLELLKTDVEKVILHLQTFGQLTQDSILNILEFRETTLKPRKSITFAVFSLLRAAKTGRRQA